MQPLGALALLRYLQPCDPLRDACWTAGSPVSTASGSDPTVTVTVIGHHAAGALAFMQVLAAAATDKGRRPDLALDLTYAGQFYLCQVLKGAPSAQGGPGRNSESVDPCAEDAVKACVDQVLFCWLLRRRSRRPLASPMVILLGMSFMEDVPLNWRDEVAAGEMAAFTAALYMPHELARCIDVGRRFESDRWMWIHQAYYQTLMDVERYPYVLRFEWLDWREVLDKMSESSNFFIDNPQKHLRQPLHRILRKFDLILSAQMRWFVQSSISDWVTFFRGFIPEAGEYLPPPLLTLNLEACHGEVVLLPSPEELKARMLELIDSITQVTSRMSSVEFELVPFCNLPQHLMFELTSKAKPATEEEAEGITVDGPMVRVSEDEDPKHA
ncbi:unnamed protein product, partial [Polarella glacialis]